MRSTHKTLVSLAIAGALAIGTGVVVAQVEGSDNQAPQTNCNCGGPAPMPAQPMGRPMGPHGGPGNMMPCAPCGQMPPPPPCGQMPPPPCAGQMPPPPMGANAAPMPPRGPQGGPGMGSGQQAGPRTNNSAVPWEDRIIFMRGALDLTDAQKDAWNTYADALDSIFHVSEPVPMGPDYLEKVVDHLKAQLAAVESMVQARAELIKVLTPEQVQELEDVEQRFHYSSVPRPRLMRGPGPQLMPPPQPAPTPAPDQK